MIGIIGAMQEEVNALCDVMDQFEATNVKDIPVYYGTLGGHQVVVCQSGVGKVNAAFTTSQLIDTFRPSMIINIGSAGGLQENQKHGDLTVATRLQYHDLDIGPETSKDSRFIFYPDHELTMKLNKTIDSLQIPYHQGLIVSGDQFITKESPAYQIIKESYTDAICVEMEATAIAHVCQRSKTPFIVLRSLSDVTHDEDNAMDFETYLPLASKRSAMLCHHFIINI